jgi:hypothetical protein
LPWGKEKKKKQASTEAETQHCHGVRKKRKIKFLLKPKLSIAMEGVKKKKKN